MSKATDNRHKADRQRRRNQGHPAGNGGGEPQGSQSGGDAQATEDGEEFYRNADEYDGIVSRFVEELNKQGDK